MEPALLGWGALRAPAPGTSSHPVGMRVPSRDPRKQSKCWTQAFSSRANQGGTEWDSPASPDPPDPRGLSSTCRSRM